MKRAWETVRDFVHTYWFTFAQGLGVYRAARRLEKEGRK